MMTTMAALMGTLPIAVGWGAGAESRRPLGLAVVGGLAFSQMITLYVTPSFYVWMEGMRGSLRRVPAAERRPVEAGLPEGVITRTQSTRVGCTRCNVHEVHEVPGGARRRRRSRCGASVVIDRRGPLHPAWLLACGDPDAPRRSSLAGTPTPRAARRSS